MERLPGVHGFHHIKNRRDAYLDDLRITPE
jgi:hypothetical protein